MDSSSEEMLSQANSLLRPLGRDVVFVGGATVHLHVDDPAAAPIRTTKDVDVVIAVVDYADFAAVEDELRKQDFRQIVSEDGPICRWSKDGLLLDVLPTKPEILGFSESEWFEAGFEHAIQHELPDGEAIAVFDVLHLLAAKIEAFRERGKGDLFASQDFEDIATILDGSSIVWEQLKSSTPVAGFVKEWLRGLERASCEDALAGHVGGYDRAGVLLDQVDALALGDRGRVGGGLRQVEGEEVAEKTDC